MRWRVGCGAQVAWWCESEPDLSRYRGRRSRALWLGVGRGPRSSGLGMTDVELGLTVGPDVGRAAVGLVTFRDSLDDDRLAVMAAGGDERAFRLLFVRWRTRLERQAERIVGSRAAAEDVAQTALISAYQALAARRQEGSFAGWLTAIAQNAALSDVRADGRHRTEELDELAVSRDLDVDSDLLVREHVRELFEDISYLPGRQRSVLLARVLGGEAYGDIASALGITVGAARQALSDATGGLRVATEARERSCIEVRGDLSGAGPGRRSAPLRAHLRSCGACRAFAERRAPAIGWQA